MAETSNNKYAKFLKEQGSYVINVGGVDWYDYGGFMMPAYLPHCVPAISEEVATKVLKISGRPFARWSSKFGEVNKSTWWCIIKRKPWKLEGIKDRGKRYKIRKGKKSFFVRPLTIEEILNDCPRVTQLATTRYKTKTELETPETLERSVNASQKVPGVIEYLGCFCNATNTLASFSENYIQDDAVFCNIIRHDPAFLKKNSSYAFVDGMLNYYLNEKQFAYLTNGWRNIYHETEFHDHLISVFGYIKEYSLLNTIYSRPFELAVKTAYPFRAIIGALCRKGTNSYLDKIAAVLRQEEIAKSCHKS